MNKDWVMDNISLKSTDATIGMLLGLGVIAVYIHFYYKRKYSYWDKRGIKGPKPWILIGNLPEILRIRSKIDKDLVKRYGKLVGLYLGTRPILLVADPEVIRQICIKDFDAFPNHEMLNLWSKYQREFIFFLQDDHWRRVRALQSPTFTSSRIKRMYRLLDTCSNDIVCLFQEQLNEGSKEKVVHLRNLFAFCSTDCIATCCFGLKLERSDSTNLKAAAARNKFVQVAMRMFEFSFWQILIAFILRRPLLEDFSFRMNPLSKTEGLAQMTEKIIEARRKSGRKFDDYLQMLLDAQLDNDVTLDDNDTKENHYAGLSQDSMRDDQKNLIKQVESSKELNQPAKSMRTLLDHEIHAASMFMLLVGSETTATLLTNVIYALAFHPKIQQQLREEIEKIVEWDTNKERMIFNYDTLTSCEYLDAVISETLRHLTILVATDRVSTRDYYIEKYNLTLPKGSTVQMAMYEPMNNPDYWDDPDTFNPERFMPGNRSKIVPGSYCPFGIGPRYCIGLRFSLTEVKLAVSKLILKFRFEPALNTVYPPECQMMIGVNRPKRPEVKLIALST